jgi:Ulp1 family protease
MYVLNLNNDSYRILKSFFKRIMYLIQYFLFQIYVPINTANDHWFLMVLSVQLGVVYHLDSHCRMEEVSSRRATMSLIVSNQS